MIFAGITLQPAGPPAAAGLPDVAPFDMLAAAILTGGIACQWLHARMPRGLGTSLFVFATTVGLGLAAFHHQWPPVADLYRVGLLGAALSLLWAFLGRRSVRERGDPEDGAIRPAEPPDSPPGPGTSPPSSAGAGETFLAWSFVTGVATVTLVGYVLVRATWPRVTDAHAAFEPLPPEGLIVLASLLAALLFWRGPARRSRQPTMLLAIAALLIWWTSLMIPSASLADRIPEARRLPLQPGWWTWTVQLQVGLAGVLVVATVLQEQFYRRRRARAWPDRLDDLIEPYACWPGFIQTEAVISALILIFGVYQIVRAGRLGWELSALNCLTCFTAAIACLFMTYRRWSGNTAGLGMALLTLAVVALACAVVGAAHGPGASAEYAQRMPVLFNAILVALWLMIALWSWLTRFWQQQLITPHAFPEGAPAPGAETLRVDPPTAAWTTAGRMIPFAGRTAFLLIAISVLVAWQMALWSDLVPSSEDNSISRTVCGAAAMLLLALQGTREGRRRDSTAVATLAVALFLAALVFVFLRLPPSRGRGWFIQYDAVVLGVLAIPILLLAEALPETRWRAFATPLWFLALLVLPARALRDLLPPIRPPEAWVSPLTLAALAALYAFAGKREHRRAFLVLGAVLFLSALIGVYHLCR